MKTIFTLALSASLVALTQSTAFAADAARGKQVYNKVGCYQCHGYEGQGANTGPKLAPEPMAVEGLTAYLRNAASTSMPPYSEKILSDKDVVDIHAYLSAIKKPPAGKSIPLLNNP
jgi:ubiquinol-cytochrome c reductase cytochrome c subunit